jgi:predicted regulator of Ras-like GTPase activity (Roadblock/LC7/MglB family)
VVEGTEGGVAGLLMGFDGIPVDHYIRDGAQVDIESVGMEFSVVLKDIKRAAEMLEAGTTTEVAVRAERMTTIVHLLNDEYFVALTLRPDGNFGKGRFLLRRSKSRILNHLQ